MKEEPSLNKKLIRTKGVIEKQEHFEYLKNLDERTRFLEYISRIARLQEFYTRKFLSELTINNRTEYIFLNTIHLMSRARKTDLINIHMVEYTTGMDTIKRLISSGLIEEMQDESDKRAKLLVLSKKGKKVLDEANKKIDEEKNMFLSCISANKWKKTLAVLEEIDDFHNDIYLRYNDKTSSELLNLMASLKHLPK